MGSTLLTNSILMGKLIYMSITLGMMSREDIISLISQGEIKRLEDNTEYLVISNDSQSSENEQQ
jgi:hypothetical protein